MSICYKWPVGAVPDEAYLAGVLAMGSWKPAPTAMPRDGEAFAANGVRESRGRSIMVAQWRGHYYVVTRDVKFNNVNEIDLRFVISRTEDWEAFVQWEADQKNAKWYSRGVPHLPGGVMIEKVFRLGNGGYLYFTPFGKTAFIGGRFLDIKEVPDEVALAFPSGGTEAAKGIAAIAATTVMDL